MKTFLERNIKSSFFWLNKGLIKFFVPIVLVFSKEIKPFKPLPLVNLIKKFSIKSPEWWPSKIFLIEYLSHCLNNNLYLLSLANDWIPFNGFFPWIFRISAFIKFFFKTFFTSCASFEEFSLNLWSITKNFEISFFFKD